jgi:hypothetical protein
MNNKQTAGQEFLEWYNDYLDKNGCSPSDYDVNYFWKHHYFEKEKQQIIDAYDDGNYAYGMGIKEPEQYYNETFKKNEQ